MTHHRAPSVGAAEASGAAAGLESLDVDGAGTGSGDVAFSGVPVAAGVIELVVSGSAFRAAGSCFTGSGFSKLLRYLPRSTSPATISWNPLIFASGWYFSGYTSINFTIQSLSVPVVDAKRLAMIFPETTTSSVRGSLTHDSTSGR